MLTPGQSEEAGQGKPVLQAFPGPSLVPRRLKAVHPWPQPKRRAKISQGFFQMFFLLFSFFSPFLFFWLRSTPGSKLAHENLINATFGYL
jgi:hypothetical protein